MADIARFHTIDRFVPVLDDTAQSAGGVVVMTQLQASAAAVALAEECTGS